MRDPLDGGKDVSGVGTGTEFLTMCRGQRELVGLAHVPTVGPERADWLATKSSSHDPRP